MMTMMSSFGVAVAAWLLVGASSVHGQTPEAPEDLCESAAVGEIDLEFHEYKNEHVLHGMRERAQASLEQCGIGFSLPGLPDLSGLFSGGGMGSIICDIARPLIGEALRNFGVDKIMNTLGNVGIDIGVTGAYGRPLTTEHIAGLTAEEMGIIEARRMNQILRRYGIDI